MKQVTNIKPFTCACTAMLAVLLCVVVALGVPVCSYAAGSSTDSASQASKSAPSSTTTPAKASAKKKKVKTGIHKVGKNYYFYNKKGKRKKKEVIRDGKWTYYATKKGAIEARKKGKKYYYNNGKRMTSADTKDYKAYLAAKKMVKKLTKESDSKAKKRLKCFKWLMKQPTIIHRSWSYSREAWPAVYAMDHFKKIGGDCQSYGAAFAYMAAYIGYKKTYVCTDSKTAPGGGHSWAMIGDAVFDAMFAAEGSFHTYYNSTHGTYEVNPTTRTKLPMFNPKHAKKK